MAVAYTYSNAKYKWIERESRFLGALLKDYDEVLSSEDQITQKASQFLNPDQLIQAGITLRLNEREKSWITNARNVVSEATRCLQIFEDLRKRSNSSEWFVFLLITDHLLPMIDVARGMKWIEERINNNLGMMASNKGKKETVCARDIYAALEQSRFKVRSLLARSIVDKIDEYQSLESEPMSVSSRATELVSSLNMLIALNTELMNGMVEKMIPIMMHVELLPSFMEDLQLLKLESEMEKSWLVEASKMVEEAINDIATITRTSNRQRRWLDVNRNWRARWKLEGGIMSIVTRISGLLETKERYGFKFVTRRSSRFARKSPQQQTQEYQITDKYLSAAVNNIRNNLIDLPKKSKKLSSHVSAMSKELEYVHKLFKDTKATEDHAIAFRSAYLETLKRMTREAEECSNTHIQDSESELKTISEVRGITHAVNLLQRCIKVYSIEVREDSCSVVGLEENVYELVSHLTAPRKERSVISIVGMKGIGKTTLAKEVYNHRTIKKAFKIRCWVSVPEVYTNNYALLETVGNQVLNTQEEDTEDTWIEKMSNLLKQERYLVVLDNVSSKGIWEALKVAFPEMRNRSRIVLTTCKKEITSHADQNSTYHHHLRLRTKHESWDLFTQIVHHCPDKLKNEAKEVLGAGGGLPLAVIRVGYLLSWKGVLTPEEYLKELEHFTQGQNQTPWLDTLQVNSADLQLHPKCLSYFQLFPKDFEIPARRIVASWSAQGLAQGRTDGKELLPEDIAYKYLAKLIGCNVIQVVQRKPNGKVKTCRLPSVVRHVLLQDDEGYRSQMGSQTSTASNVDGNQNLHDRDDGNNYNTSSRQIDCLNSNWQNVLLKKSCPQSILFFDTREKIKPGEEVGEIISRGIASGLFGQLQALDLERVFRPKLPETIGKLKQLAYLSLRRTCLLTIPESIGDLVNLITLDLKHTQVRTLPSSIWKLKKIRHLYLNEICQIPRPNSISMKNLQILSGVFVDKGHPLKDRLDKLTKLRKLALAFQLGLEEQTVVAKWIEKLIDLESLRLRSIDEKREPQSLILESISHLHKLSSLHLFGRLENQVIIYQLPQSLTHLTLSGSGIKNDPMAMLGELRRLRSLSFYYGSYLGTDMVCYRDGFPFLLLLKLWNLENLRILVLQKGAMPNLRKLDIRSCQNLTITD
ncbi:probable disease resistance RPP8-like protein 2 [Malus sylvestris]|uniref:probable disease resistance RPP8-like protein 2 n=1 Tax=Malus sylvestris TaxID=3752 RepID=UPI0021ABA8E8|nr:probable disease resistance RPP8-like protein 2 [Malus sylvestris]